MAIYINTIIENLSLSLQPVQKLISGFGYVIGIIFIIVAIQKLYQIGNAKARSSSGIGIYVPIAYMTGGTALIYLSSAIGVMSRTVFGLNSVLQYTQPNPVDLTQSIIILIETIGLIWFVRGCILITTASEPGADHGVRGLLFIAAGTLSINFYSFSSVL